MALTGKWVGHEGLSGAGLQLILPAAPKTQEGSPKNGMMADLKSEQYLRSEPKKVHEFVSNRG